MIPIAIRTSSSLIKSHIVWRFARKAARSERTPSLLLQAPVTQKLSNGVARPAAFQPRLSIRIRAKSSYAFWARPLGEHWSIWTRTNQANRQRLPTQKHCIPRCSAPSYLGPPENGFDGVGEPSPRCLGAGCGRKLLDDNEAVDFTAQVSIEKAGIVPHGHASI